MTKELVRQFFLARTLISDRQESPYIDEKDVREIVRRGNRKRFIIAIRTGHYEYANRHTN